MRGPHNIWHLIRMGATFERTGAIDVVFAKLDLPPLVKVTARILGWPFKWLGRRGDVSLQPMVRALVALGPAYIKFGQLMSTRPDIVGVNMADELRVLQDRLPAFDTNLAKQMIADELGQSTDDLLLEFSEPVAAASIAQVHKAVLRKTGQTVAVKILRPNVERDFLRDVDAFHFCAWLIECLAPSTKRLKPRAVIEHFESVVRAELDLRIEAAACAEFAANTQTDQGFFVPSVHWETSSKNVMVSSWIEGPSLSKIDGLGDKGANLPELVVRVIQIFLRHALRDGFFHADMHHGNLKLAANGDLVALDCGIMGRIDEYTRRVYAEILMGFIKKDYLGVAQVHFEAGYIGADQSVNEFAQALRSVGEPIFGQDASHISMARLLAHLFEVTERFGMETRTELILLQRTMVVVEGVGRSLDPTLNMWEVSRPEIENYIQDHFGPRAMLKDMRRMFATFARLGPRLPQLLDDAILLRTQPHHSVTQRATRSRIGWASVGAICIALLFGVWTALQ